MTLDSRAHSVPNPALETNSIPIAVSNYVKLPWVLMLAMICLIGAAAYGHYELKRLESLFPDLLDPESVAKIVLTTLLSILAYLIHILPHRVWHRVPWSRHLILSIPTLAFMYALLQHKDKEAAIFGMALAALYLALEHFASLEKQSSALKKQTCRMTTVTKRLRAQAVNLRSQTSSMKTIGENLKKQVGNLENALGTREAQSRIFDAYCNLPASAAAREIYAVHRYFNIDREWWNNFPSSDLDLAWARYEQFDTGTLYASLKAGRPTRVLYVSSMPSKLSSQDGKAEFFSKFIGLLWYYLTLRRVAAQNRGATYEIKIAECTNWIHVIGETVFQIVGEPPADIVARELTFNLHDTNEEKMRIQMASWAIDDITTVAGRGNNGKEYICAAILHAGLRQKWQCDDPIDADANALLDAMGFAEWHASCVAGTEKFASCPSDLSREYAKTCCRQLVLDFFRQCLPPGRTGRTRKTDLTRELL
jgi:hypothetical protein